jgi:hypothetical protein
MGVFLSSRLGSSLVASGVDPASVSLDSLIDPLARMSVSIEGPLRGALAVAISNMFIIALIGAVLALVSVLFAPRGKITQLAEERTEL